MENLFHPLFLVTPKLIICDSRLKTIQVHSNSIKQNHDMLTKVNYLY